MRCRAWSGSLFASVVLLLTQVVAGQTIGNALRERAKSGDTMPRSNSLKLTNQEKDMLLILLKLRGGMDMPPTLGIRGPRPSSPFSILTGWV
jgi:hypothetical protein